MVDVFPILLAIDDDRFLEWACLMNHDYQETFAADREGTHKYDKLGRKSISRWNKLSSGLSREGKVFPIIAHGF
jgi:hypothetical protein